MSIDVEELLRTSVTGLPAPSPEGEERTAAVVRGIVLGRAMPRRPRPRARLLLTVGCLLVLAAACGTGLWWHERGGSASQPMALGGVPDYGYLGLRLDAPAGTNPFGSRGVRLPLQAVARISGFTVLLPGHGRPAAAWFDAGLGARAVLDYPRERVRIVEQATSTCCGGGAEIDTLAGLKKEAATFQGARVTTIGGYRSVVIPPGVLASPWYVQVSRPVTEVIVLAPPSVPLAALERLIESLRPLRLERGR